MEKLGRRDTIKMVISLPAGYAVSKVLSAVGVEALRPNIIVVVLDALTARNMSLYGYPRETTPNIERFARKATVYHSHYSSGTFTTPGTASMLTGMYPWTHRAVNLAGEVAGSFRGRNLFNLSGPSYHQAAFSQNINAEILLMQFNDALDEHLPLGSFSVLDQYIAHANDRDPLVKYHSFDGFLCDDWPGSLVLGVLNKYLEEYRVNRMQAKVEAGQLQFFERNLFFNIEDVFKGLSFQVINSKSPLLTYFHLMPPHEPYVPGVEFKDLFNDGWDPPRKKGHSLLKNIDSDEQLRGQRLLYDRYIATVDSAFGRFVDEIAAAGVLENAFVILTSDHGQMFERGVEGHLSPLVYEPAVHIPLVISAPGQQARQDVHSLTNNVDLLPTIMKCADCGVPEWCQGRILPGLGGEESIDRAVYSMDAKESSAMGKLTPISIAMRKGRYKLIYYQGYTAYRGLRGKQPYGRGVFEFYDMERDPEELHDIIADAKSAAVEMREELLEAYRVSGENRADHN